MVKLQVVQYICNPIRYDQTCLDQRWINEQLLSSNI